MKNVTRMVKPRRAALHVPLLILSVLLEAEHNAILKVLPKVATRYPRTGADEALEIDRWAVKRAFGNPIDVATAFINGMGNARSAIETFVFLNRIAPRYVFLCGISGTLDPAKADLGDVVVAKAVQWWSLNKIMKDAAKVEADGKGKYLRMGGHYFRKDISSVGAHSAYWQRRLTSFVAEHRTQLLSNTDSELLKARSSLQRGKDRENVLHYDKVVSWEYVLSEQAIRDKIAKDSEGGLAIEMESGGFATGVRRRNEEVEKLQKETGVIPGDTAAFVFRGISDVCHNKGEESPRWREIAMVNATGALVDFLVTFSDSDWLS
jgi:nucleoside phosphorylase